MIFSFLLMVYLNKQEAEEIVMALSKTKDQKIRKIIRKMKSPGKRVVYERSKSGIKRLLHEAFRKRKKVKINYYSLSSDEATTRVVDIYRSYNDCIIAYCNLREDERTFVIDRINAVALLDEKYAIPENWSQESIILDK
jgi:predicted DNA-binding transcriptional regulator YafY